MMHTMNDRTTRESAHPTFKTMLKGVFTDSQGAVHHFIYQVTEEPSVVYSQAALLRPAVEAMYAARDCELLSLQFVVETATRVNLDELLGRVAQGAGQVVPMVRRGTAEKTD